MIVDAIVLAALVFCPTSSFSPSSFFYVFSSLLFFLSLLLKTYARAEAYLDVSSRCDILNRRLDVIQRLLDNLTNQLTNESAHHLEWIIIVLIVVEVVLDLAKTDFFQGLLGMLWWR